VEKERMKLGHCLGHRFKFPSALLDARKGKLSLLSSHVLFQICWEKKTALDDLACLENCHKNGGGMLFAGSSLAVSCHIATAALLK